MKASRLTRLIKFLGHVLEINWNLLIGYWKLMRLPEPAITVFGGSRIPENHEYAKMAQTLAKDLVEDGFSIITGGGPGIMAAANLGAYNYSKRCKKKKCDHTRCKRKMVSLGIGVSGLETEKLNKYIHDQIIMDHFFTRKWLLVRYSVGFVVFPGGFGTMDELFEILTLTQTKFMNPAPIVLMGADYWNPLFAWIKKEVLSRGLISENDIGMVQIVDTPEQAFSIISQTCKECLER